MQGNGVKKPVRSGVARVPVVIQMEALECGAACLAMVCAYYHKWIPLEKMRLMCGVSRDGASAKNVVRAARAYGLSAEGYRFDRSEDVKKNATFPCIIHWNFEHFVVLCGFRGGYAYLNDPARGNIRVSMKEFDEAFTGVCLFFSPAENFIPDGKKKSLFGSVKRYLSGARPAFLLLGAAILIGCLLQALLPGFRRFFSDRLLTGENEELLTPFLLILFVLSVLIVVVAAIRSIVTLRLKGKLVMTGKATFFWKLLRLPTEFFSQRMAGDVILRQNSHTSIAKTLTETLLPMVIQIFMMVLYIVMLFRSSPVLTLFAVFALAVNLILGQVLADRRRNIMRMQLRDEGRLTGTTLYGIQMIETIKASGAEAEYFRRWAGQEAVVNAGAVKAARLELTLGAIPGAIRTFMNLLVMTGGVWLCMEGRFTLGGILLFQGVLTMLLTPAEGLIEAGSAIQKMNTDLERIEDVMDYPEAVCFHEEHEELTDRENETEDEDYEKLSGRIELKNLSFGYSVLDAPLIRDFSLSVPQGGRIALVGESGCGKSTLARLISGLYQPWGGEILFDGKPASSIDRRIFTASVAVVDQETTLFSDTVANNIKMWDNSIEDFEMILAAEDAQIRSDIMERDGGFMHRLLEGGRDLSGGQRQQLEIARVLAQDPTLLILDEATSALDATTEHEVMDAVKQRGITCILIAHRLSTIRDCDEIIVLEHGRVVERGTHEELYQKGGIYTDLISND